MAKPKRQNFLQGAIILSFSMILVKLIGAFFKLPLTNILGGEGMGYFSSSYTIFSLFSTLALAGIPVSISKVVCEKYSVGKYKDVKNVLKVSLLSFFLIGITLSLLMFVFSKNLSQLLNNTGSYYSIMAISPSILFICIMSVFKGYYQGLSQMVPTAKSQVIEALTKMIFGLSFSYFIFIKATSEYSVTKTVFFKKFEDDVIARDYIMQLASSGAVLGVTLSCVIGSIYLMIRHKCKGDSITKNMLQSCEESEPKKQLIKRVIHTAIPITLAAVVINVTSIIDLGSILNRLTVALGKDINSVISMYRDVLPTEITIDKIPNFLYGSYSAMAITIFNLVPSFSVSFAVSALPSVTSAYVSQNKEAMQKQISSILKITSIFAIPAGLGIFTFSYPILDFLFHEQKSEVLVASGPLALLGIAAIFVSISISLNSILQAVGMISAPVKLMIIGGSIKLFLNYFLVSIPSINIKGATIGTLVCYIIIVILSLFILLVNTNIRINFINIFIKPLICAVFCVVLSKLSFNVLYNIFHHRYVLIPSIIVAIISYIFFIIYLKVFDADDLKLYPKVNLLKGKK